MCVENRLHTLGTNFLQWLGFEKDQWKPSFLSLPYEPLVFTLSGVAPPRLSLSQGRRQLHVLNVKTSLPRS